MELAWRSCCAAVHSNLKLPLGNVVLSTKSPLGHRMCGYELWFPKDQVSSKDLSNDPHGLMYIDKLLHQCLLCL